MTYGSKSASFHRMKLLRLLLPAILLFGTQFAYCATPADNVTASPVDKQATDGTAYALKDRFNEIYSGELSAITVTYATTTNVDFKKAALQTITLTGNVTITASNMKAGQTVILRVIASGGSRNFTALPSWVFIGAAAPTSVASGKTGVFVLRAFGTTAASVVARYEVQP